MNERARRAGAGLRVLLGALAGQAVVDDDVRSRPHRAGRAAIAWGGQSARSRGARASGSISSRRPTATSSAMRTATSAAGRTPGNITLPSPDTPTTIFVAGDLDRAWEELGPYLLHDATTYAAWNPQGNTASLSYGTTVEELRAENGAHRVMTVDDAIAHVRRYGLVGLHPLCGGLPPELAWPYLRRVAEDVLPNV
jgi:hypothetical protein